MITLDFENRSGKGRLIGLTNDLEPILNNFSVRIPNIDFIRKKTNNPYIPDTAYAIGKNGLFNFGLYSDIIQFMDNAGIEYTTSDSFNNRCDCKIHVEDFFDDLKLKHRDYGVVAVSNALENGCGVILSATGSGKSFLTASLLENIKRENIFIPFKCLILVPGVSLVNQLVNDFDQYGVSYTYSGWTGKIDLQDTEIVICNTENFNHKFDANPWIRDVNVLVCDEVHKIKEGNVTTKLINKVKTHHKYGFTGTLPKEKIDQWKIIGTFGPIIFEKNSKELRDIGYLSDVRIKCIKLIHPNIKGCKYLDELENIYSNKKRNVFIQTLVNKLDKNVLILVNHLNHGESIFLELDKIPHKKVYFVHGGMPVKERNDIIHEMEYNDNVICIAMSSIFSTGINIKNLPFIIFAIGGKSFTRIIQAIGRGLRLHKDKKRLTLFDIYDNMKYSMSHFEERKNFYNEEQIKWEPVEINL
jgi:superfamily II DNA or RNA helicase